MLLLTNESHLWTRFGKMRGFFQSCSHRLLGTVKIKDFCFSNTKIKRKIIKNNHILSPPYFCFVVFFFLQGSQSIFLNLMTVTGLAYNCYCLHVGLAYYPYSSWMDLSSYRSRMRGGFQTRSQSLDLSRGGLDGMLIREVEGAVLPHDGPWAFEVVVLIFVYVDGRRCCQFDGCRHVEFEPNKNGARRRDNGFDISLRLHSEEFYLGLLVGKRAGVDGMLAYMMSLGIRCLSETMLLFFASLF